MGLGKFAAEALGEGFFLKLLGEAWHWAKRIFLGFGIGDNLGKKVTDHLIGGKDWEDEHFFARDLAEAELGPEKKKMIETAMVAVQLMDEQNGTTYAKNFRFIVVNRDGKEPEPPAAAAAAGVNPKRPGVIILEDLGNGCDDWAGVFMRVVALGAMQDTSTNLERFVEFGKSKIWPFLRDEIYGKVNCKLSSLATKLGEEEAAEKRRAEEIKVMPAGWRKIVAKIGFELVKYTKI